MREWPVLGIGLGAQVLALAAGGRSDPAPLTFEVGSAQRVAPDALNGYLPERFPIILYLRDWAVPPDYAVVLAQDDRQRPVLWQIGRNAFGFAAHPGLKVAMVEDLIMEFEESPNDPGPQLDALRAVQRPLEDALVPIMTGLVQLTGWIAV
jgi:GMP synthase-like glutamine amidotransferase